MRLIFSFLFYVSAKRELEETAEKTAYFYAENQFISAYESFVYQKPTTLNLQVLEDTLLVKITRTAAAKLLAFSPKFDILARTAMENELIANQKIIQSLLTLNPEKRYFKLLEDNPNVFQRIPQHYIASFLGVQPESLSRIKKRFHEKS